MNGILILIVFLTPHSNKLSSLTHFKFYFSLEHPHQSFLEMPILIYYNNVQLDLIVQ